MKKKLDAAKDFHDDESGAMVVFTFFILAMMLMVGGLAVDMMRFETYRVRLQAAVDQAALTSSSLAVCTDATDPEASAERVVEAAGFAPQLITVVVDRGPGYCDVDIHASIAVNTIFMQMVGVEELETYITASAFEQAQLVEISLVLDYSHSMNGPKVANLRTATADFVDTVLVNSAGNSTSINLVPYGGSVNPGHAMFDYLNGVRLGQPQIGTDDDGNPILWPQLSTCLEIPASDYQHDDLPSEFLPETPIFEYYNTPAAGDHGWCPYDSNRITYGSQSLTDLVTSTNSLRLTGGTGTNIAMKWGVALLNPSSRPAFAHLGALGEVDPAFTDRPLDWNLPGAQKFIILMTDGGITGQRRPDDPWDVRNLTQRLPSSRSSWDSSKNTNLLQLYDQCDLAKDNGVVVFTIAFNAPNAAKTQMANCASSPAHYYDVEDDLSAVFTSIAGQISSLRLTN